MNFFWKGPNSGRVRLRGLLDLSREHEQPQTRKRVSTVCSNKTLFTRAAAKLGRDMSKPVGEEILAGFSHGHSGFTQHLVWKPLGELGEPVTKAQHPGQAGSWARSPWTRQGRPFPPHHTDRTQGGSAQLQDKVPKSRFLPWDGSRSVKWVPNLSAFYWGAGCPRNRFLSHLTQSSWNQPANLRCLGPPSMTGSAEVYLSQLQRTCSTAARRQREQKTTHSGERNQQTCLISKLHTQTHSPQGFEGPWESSARLLCESLPLYEAIP